MTPRPYYLAALALLGAAIGFSFAGCTQQKPAEFEVLAWRDNDQIQRRRRRSAGMQS